MHHLLRIFLLLILFNSQYLLAQDKKCLQGDCTNGFSTLLRGSDTIITYFKNGKPSKELIFASPNHSTYLLIRVDSVGMYLNRTPEFDLIGRGKYSNDKIIDSKDNFHIMVLLKNGDLEYTTKHGKLVVHPNGKVEGLAATDDNSTPNLQRRFESNGKDFRYLQYKDEKLIGGMLYIAALEKEIFFTSKNDQISISNAGDEILFGQTNADIENKPALDYTTIVSKFKKLDGCRNIEKLVDAYWLGLERKELKPVKELMKKMIVASEELNNFTKNLTN